MNEPSLATYTLRADELDVTIHAADDDDARNQAIEWAKSFHFTDYVNDDCDDDTTDATVIIFGADGEQVSTVTVTLRR